MTCEVLQTAFFDKYFPDSIKNKKEVEFIHIRQSDKSVREYEAKFEELSKFSSYFKYTQNEAWKACHFERGLKEDIKKKVAAFESGISLN